MLPDAGVSPDGVNLKLPYFALNIPFPSLTVKLGKDATEVELKLGEINKSEHKSEDE